MKYPTPSHKFMEEVVGPYINKESDDLEVHKFIGIFYANRHPVSNYLFYRVRAKIARYNYQKHLEYITSPESETYWTS